MSFQLVVGVLLPAAAVLAPSLRLSALALVSVLTTTCFFLTEGVCNMYLGAYQLSHNVSGTPASVIERDSNTQHWVNAIFVLFSGCVTCSVANSLTLLFLGIAASPEGGNKEVLAPAAAEMAEAPAAQAEVAV